MTRDLFRVVVVRAVVTALASTAGLVGAVLVDDLAGPVVTNRQQPVGHERQPTTAASRIERLVRGHACWTNAAQAPRGRRGVLPGHVVVTTGQGRTRWSATLVGAALDHVFEHRNPDLTVHAFCR